MDFPFDILGWFRWFFSLPIELIVLALPIALSRPKLGRFLRDVLGDVSNRLVDVLHSTDVNNRTVSEVAHPLTEEPLGDPWTPVEDVQVRLSLQGGLDDREVFNLTCRVCSPQSLDDSAPCPRQDPETCLRVVVEGWIDRKGNEASWDA